MTPSADANESRSSRRSTSSPTTDVRALAAARRPAPAHQPGQRLEHHHGHRDHGDGEGDDEDAEGDRCRAARSAGCAGARAVRRALAKLLAAPALERGLLLEGQLELARCSLAFSWAVPVKLHAAVELQPVPRGTAASRRLRPTARETARPGVDDYLAVPHTRPAAARAVRAQQAPHRPRPSLPGLRLQAPKQRARERCWAGSSGFARSRHGPALR